MRDFTNRGVNLILANATTALQAATNGTTTIPVLGTSVTEYSTALNIAALETAGYTAIAE